MFNQFWSTNQMRLFITSNTFLQKTGHNKGYARFFKFCFRNMRKLQQLNSFNSGLFWWFPIGPGQILYSDWSRTMIQNLQSEKWSKQSDCEEDRVLKSHDLTFKLKLKILP